MADERVALRHRQERGRQITRQPLPRVAAVAIAVAVVLVIVFLITPAPMIGTYVTADGRKLALRENGTARYGVSYKNVWMTTTYTWSRSGNSVKLVLPGVSKLQPGFKIRGKKLVGNGGVWVKR